MVSNPGVRGRLMEGEVNHPLFCCHTNPDRSHRYSMASISDTNHPTSAGGLDSSTSESHSSQARARHDSNGFLGIPTPRTFPTGGSARSSEDAYMSDMASSSLHRLVPSPEQYADPYGDKYSPQFDAQVARTAGNNGGVLRNPTVSSQYPGETQNPFRPAEAHVISYDEQFGGYSTEPEEAVVPPQPRQARGVSLSDNGPVLPPDGVRRVPRPGRRSNSQVPQNRYSRSSMVFNLPPGAAPPQPGGSKGGF